MAEGQSSPRSQQPAGSSGTNGTPSAIHLPGGPAPHHQKMPAQGGMGPPVGFNRRPSQSGAPPQFPAGMGLPSPSGNGPPPPPPGGPWAPSPGWGGPQPFFPPGFGPPGAPRPGQMPSPGGNPMSPFAAPSPSQPLSSSPQASGKAKLAPSPSPQPVAVPMGDSSNPRPRESSQQRDTSIPPPSSPWAPPMQGGPPIPPAPGSLANTGPAGDRGGNPQSAQDNKQGFMGGSGIDLREEEEAMRSRDLANTLSISAADAAALSAGAQTSSAPIMAPSFIDLFPLARSMHRIALEHDLTLDPESLNTVSAAMRIRFRNLLECMIKASRHRCWSSHSRPPPLYGDSSDEEAQKAGTSAVNGTKKRKRRPMYHEELISDPRRWITALEKADRGEELKARRRRAEKQRERETASAVANAGVATGGVALDGDGDTSMGGGSASDAGADAEQRKKKKPPSAKNLSEDVRRRMANTTAARALGGPATPKWMLMSGGGDSGSFSGSSKSLGKPKEEEGKDGFSKSSGLGSLPKPRFAPAPGLNGSSSTSDSSGPWARALAPSGLSGTPLRTASTTDASGDKDGKVNPHGWGDPALRALAKEEEARKKLKRVNLGDALHAVEMERKGGAGRGSGDLVAWKWRNRGGAKIREPGTEGN